MTSGLDSAEVLIDGDAPFELLPKMSSRKPREPPSHTISFVREKRSLPLRVGAAIVCPPSKLSNAIKTVKLKMFRLLVRVVSARVVLSR